MIDPTAAQGMALSTGAQALDSIIKSRQAAINEEALREALMERQRQNLMANALIGPAMFQAIGQSLQQSPSIDLNAINRAANRAAGVYEDVRLAETPAMGAAAPLQPAPMGVAQVNMGAIGQGGQAILNGFRGPSPGPVNLMGPGAAAPATEQIPGVTDVELMKAMGLIPKETPSEIAIPEEMGGGTVNMRPSMPDRTPQSEEPAIVVQPDGSQVMQGELGPQTLDNMNIFNPKVFKFVANELMKRGSVPGTAIMSQPTMDTLKAMEQQRVLAAGSAAKISAGQRAEEIRAELKKYDVDLDRMSAQERLIFAQAMAQNNNDVRMALEAMRGAIGLARDQAKPRSAPRGGAASKPDRFYMQRYQDALKTGVLSKENIRLANILPGMPLITTPQTGLLLDSFANNYNATTDPRVRAEFEALNPNVFRLAKEKGLIGGGKAAAPSKAAPSAPSAAPAAGNKPKVGDEKTLKTGRVVVWNGSAWVLKQK